MVNTNFDRIWNDMIRYHETEFELIEQYRTAAVYSVVMIIQCLRNCIEGGISFQRGKFLGTKPDYKYFVDKEFESIFEMVPILLETVGRLSYFEGGMADPRQGLINLLHYDFQKQIPNVIRAVKEMVRTKDDLEVNELAWKQAQKILKATEPTAWQLCYEIDPVHYKARIEKYWKSLSKQLKTEDVTEMISAIRAYADAVNSKIENKSPEEMIPVRDQLERIQVDAVQQKQKHEFGVIGLDPELIDGNEEAEMLKMKFEHGIIK